MRVCVFALRALAIGLIAAFLNDCGAQSGVNAVPGAEMAQSTVHKASASGDLIYALARGPRNAGRVFVLTYPDGNYVSQFYAPNKAGLLGICSDAMGDVFITAWDGQQGYIYEYPHGSTTPSATLKLSQSDTPVGCAVNHANGDLAVSFASGASGVAIFHNASGTPTYYTLKGLSGPFGSTTYDSSGNLFSTFFNTSEAAIYELAKGSKTLTKIEFDAYMNPYYLQWDGKYLAIAIFDQHARWLVYRVNVSDSYGQIISTIYFDGLGRRSAGSFWIQGDSIIVPVSRRSKSGKLAIYAYPKGGSPESIISGYKVSYLTVSVAPSR